MIEYKFLLFNILVNISSYALENEYRIEIFKN